MALRGSAVVAIWNDITPAGRDNFIEWHNRQHIPERVGIPGFLRGRRYVAEYGTPAYYTLYEAADQAVLTGAAYLERLNNPTPWTKEATAEFRNTVRGVCTTRYSRGSGDGGVIFTLRFDPEAGKAGALEQGVIAELEKASAMKGISGAHLCIADSAASGIETAERKGRQVGVPNWIVMVEGSSVDAVDAAGQALSAALARLGGTGAIEEGLYRLEFSLADFGE
ncbi:MAG: hypothetical protein JSR72_22000 [Proteobacteria bacterium]|nr:hypothetical protein [Pseudomonadota bacterium]